MLDQIPGHHAMPANTGLQFGHLRLIQMIPMPLKTAKDNEGRKQYLGSCMQTAIINDAKLIHLEDVSLWADAQHSCDVLITPIPKLSLLWAKTMLHFAGDSSPAFTGLIMVSQSKNKESTVQTKGS